MTMRESDYSLQRTLRELLLIVAALVFGFVCIRTLRFTNDTLNLVFVCAVFLTPFLAIRPWLRLRGWHRVAGTLVLTPLLLLSLLLLVMTYACGNFGRYPDVVQDLVTLRYGNNTVHLVRDCTGGATVACSLDVEQRMPLVRGIYVVRYLDSFYAAYEGSISAEGADRVRLHIPRGTAGDWEQGVDRVYSVKRHVYF